MTLPSGVLSARIRWGLRRGMGIYRVMQTTALPRRVIPQAIVAGEFPTIHSVGLQQTMRLAPDG
ncbi:MAG: hypothetical protein KatS3mg110_3321 [Pirellulaceae bacterium]|nr:MAG: hypothetical protein KatS3mg110_3321 [Pirellulaceae bacterium]